jgi:transcriptional regulator of arginine metabolism
MPSANDNTSERRKAIRQLLMQGPQPNQRKLVDGLRRLGFGATQSSVSRDLTFLGAVKTPRGYELPETGSANTGLEKVGGLLRDVLSAGPNLLVLKTSTGAAQQVALAVDRSEWPEVAGTIAGDDTVFLATTNILDQRRVVTRLRRSLGESGAGAGASAS